MPTRIGIRLRAAALAVDITATLLLSFLFGPWLGVRLGLDVYAGQGPGAGGMMAGGAAGFTLIFLAWFGTEAWWGATPAKRLLGLRVGTAEGVAASRQRLLGRWALKNAAILTALLSIIAGTTVPRLGIPLAMLSNLFGAVMLAGCFIAMGDDHQALHDILAGTAVYRRAGLAEVAPAEAEA